MSDRVDLNQVVNEGFVLESTSFRQAMPRLPKYGRMIIDKDTDTCFFNKGTPHRPDWVKVMSPSETTVAETTVNVDIASEVISEIIPGTNLSWDSATANKLNVARDLIYYSNDNTKYIRLSEGDARYLQLAGKTGGQYARGGLDTTDTLKFAATAGISAAGANIEFLYGTDGGSRAAYFDYQGKFNMDVLPHATVDTDKFVVGDGTLISYRTGTEIISDLDLANLYTSRALVNGAFQESFNCLATSDGTTITATLEQSGGGDLTMQFSDGNLVLDCTPADSVVLTPGTDTSPEENWVYIPLSTKTLTANTTGWPSEEHIPVSYFYLKSATHVQSRGAIINQNWNDHLSGTNGQGHMSHIGMWIRSQGANWFSGCDGAGTDGWVTIISGSPDNIYIKVGSGVISQMHQHTYVAKDTSATDYLNIPNHPTDPWHETQDLGTVLVDSTGASLSGKYYNVVIGGVANKTGEFSPLMAKLPSGSYSNLTDAVNDIDNYTSFEMPRQFNKESSTGFLIALLTFKHSPAGGGTFTLENSVSLRGTSGATGAAGTGTTLFEFPDNQFKVYDNLDITRALQFSLDSVTTGNTRTLTVPDGSGTIPLIEGLVGGQKLRGGTAVTDTLKFVATSGIGAAGANIEFLYGTDGDSVGGYFDYQGNLNTLSDLNVYGGRLNQGALDIYKWDLGFDTMALMKGSVAFGVDSEARGYASAVFNIENEAYGAGSAAFGYQTKANYDSSNTEFNTVVAQGSITAIIDTKTVTVVGDRSDEFSIGDTIALWVGGAEVNDSLVITDLTVYQQDGYTYTDIETDVAMANANAPGDPQLSFGLITDEHLDNTNYDSLTPGNDGYLIRQAIIASVTAFDGMTLDFVFSDGDQVQHQILGTGTTPNKPEITDFKEILNAGTYDWFVSLGNHDMLDATRDSFVAEIEQETSDLVAKGLTNLDSPSVGDYFSFDVNGMHIIVLNCLYDSSGNPKTGATAVSPYYFGSTQLAWLLQDLTDNSGKRTVVFNHVPLVTIPSTPIGYSQMDPTEATTALGYMTSSGDVIAVIGGHNHYQGETTINSIVHTCFDDLKGAAEASSNAYSKVIFTYDDEMQVTGYGTQDTYTETVISNYASGINASNIATAEFKKVNDQSGDYGFAIGIETNALGTGSFAGGRNTIAQSYLSNFIGRHNIDTGSGDSWVTTDPLWGIGIGLDAANKDNAITVFKDGITSIGTQDRVEKFNLDGRIGLKEQSAHPTSQTTDYGSIYIYDDKLYLYWDTSYLLESYWVKTVDDISFSTGNVGIGVLNATGNFQVVDTNPLLMLSSDGSNEAYSGTIRFTESTITEYKGGYVNFNGDTANRLEIGVHDVADALTASDTLAMSIFRIGGDVTVHTNLDITGTLTVNTIANGAVTDDNIIVESAGVFKYRTVSDIITNELDGTYLRLDTANNPITGDLRIYSTNALMSLGSSGANLEYSATIRLTESTPTNYVGGYVSYDGSAGNRMVFGVHNTGDALTSSDILAMSIFRTDGDVTVHTNFDVTGTSTLNTVANSTGDFLTAPTGGGLVTMRTAAQVITDLTTPLDAAYLRLDTANSPLTGDLTLTKASPVFTIKSTAASNTDAHLVIATDGGGEDSYLDLFESNTPAAEAGISLVYDGGTNMFYIKEYAAGTPTTLFTIARTTGNASVDVGTFTVNTIANATGDFMTAPTGGGLITMRTAAQVVTDLTTPLDAAYLRLDTTNSPLVGDLTISKATPIFTVAATGNTNAQITITGDGSGEDAILGLFETGTPSSENGVGLIYDGGDNAFYIKNYTAGSTANLFSISRTTGLVQINNLGSSAGNFITHSGNILQERTAAEVITDLGLANLNYWTLNGTDLYYTGGNVGIGTSSPDKLLHVYAGNSGGSPHSSSQLVFEDNASSYIQVLTPNNVWAGLLFGDPESTTIGGFLYDHSTDNLYIRSGGQNSIIAGAYGDISITSTLTIGSIANGAGNFLTESSGLVKYRTPAEVVSDLGIATDYLKLDCSNDPLTRTLEINNGISQPGRLLVKGAGSGYTHADIVLQSDGATRGTGIYTFNSIDQETWFFGNRYANWNSGFFINKQTGTAAFSESASDNAGANVTTLFAVAATGNVLIGTTTDSGYKLNVQGTGYFSNDLNIASGKTYQINSVDINTGGTLSNVAYLDQANTFTADQTLTGNLYITNSDTKIILTDTDDNSYSDIVYNGGDLYIRADWNNLASGTTIQFGIDGSLIAFFNDSGDLQLDGLVNSDGTGSNTFEGSINIATGKEYQINSVNIITPSASFDDTNDLLGASMKAIKDYGDANWSDAAMVYPGAGIAVSTGSAWGTSITDNSTNWNTAYTHSQLTSGNPHSVTKSDIGLSNVENTALSTWAGSGNITTLGTITTGVWNGTVIPINKGGTGVTSDINTAGVLNNVAYLDQSNVFDRNQTINNSSAVTSLIVTNTAPTTITYGISSTTASGTVTNAAFRGNASGGVTTNLAFWAETGESLFEDIITATLTANDASAYPLVLQNLGTAGTSHSVGIEFEGTSSVVGAKVEMTFASSTTAGLAFSTLHLGTLYERLRIESDGDLRIKYSDGSDTPDTGYGYLRAKSATSLVWVAAGTGTEQELIGGGGAGTVTSVDMSVPTGLAISGNPITTSGTLALTYASGYSIPTDSSQTSWDGKQDALTFGIAFGDVSKIVSASVGSNEYARFTASGLEGRTTAEVLADLETIGNTAFNKDFGTSGTTVAYGNHAHAGVYEPVFSKNTAFNKNFAGTGSATTPSRSDHTHSIYAPLGTGAYHTEFINITNNTASNTCLYIRPHASQVGDMLTIRDKGNTADVFAVYPSEYIAVRYGTSINEFSIDGTFAGNSDDALPTEKAVKTYVDAQVGFSVGDAHTWTADQTYNDSVKLLFGTGADCSIYHNGTDMYIDNNVGLINIIGSSIRIGDTDKLYFGTTYNNYINGDSTPELSFYLNGSLEMAIGTTGVVSPGYFDGDSLRSSSYLRLLEITTPSATTGYGKIYTKSDNKIYFQDGAGVEHEIAFV